MPHYRILFILMLVFGFTTVVQPEHVAAAGETFIVNVNSNNGDSNLGDGICFASDLTYGSGCSLVAAIQEANLTPEVDTILLARHLQLSATIPNLSTNIIFRGAYSTRTVINNSLPLFRILPGATVTFEDILLFGNDGPTIYNQGTAELNNVLFAYGVVTSIVNDGMLTMQHTDLRSWGPAGVATEPTRGLLNRGTAILRYGAIVNHAHGRAIWNQGHLTLVNFTISNNATPDNGAGIYMKSGTANLYNVTIANNTADKDDDGTGRGGGIYREGGTITLYNTLIAQNFRGLNNPIANNCAGTIISGGSNISDDTTCAGFTQVTTQALRLSMLRFSDFESTGGGGHFASAGGAAIDAGNIALLPAGVTTDQRGQPRVVNTIDVGAMEFQGIQTLNVDTLSDADLQACTPSPNDCSLRGALNRSNQIVEQDTITFSVTGTIQLTSDLPRTFSDFILQGPGAHQLSIRGKANMTFPILIILSGHVTIDGITIENGSDTGLAITSGHVTLSNSRIVNNSTRFPNMVGGINNYGILTITNSVIANNSGGGIYSFQDYNTFFNLRAKPAGLTLINSTVSSNSGMGIRVNNIDAYLYNTTVVQSTGNNLIVEGIGTITAYNSMLSGGTPVCSGTIINGGGNLSTDSSCSGFTQATSTQLNLGNLANNGGSTETHALLPGSVAINAGNVALLPYGVITDQRSLSYHRISGSALDIGAFEAQVQGVALMPSPPEMPPLLPTSMVTLVSPVHETSENPVAFTWIGSSGVTSYRLTVQEQTNGSLLLDQTVSTTNCNGNICAFVPNFVPQAGRIYLWIVYPITANGPGTASAEAIFTFNPAAPSQDITVPGEIVLPGGQ